MSTLTPIGARLQLALDAEYSRMQNEWFFKWHHIGGDSVVEIDGFDGRMIRYGGLKFSGTPRDVYWSTIQRYARQKIGQLFDELEVELQKYPVEIRSKALNEAESLIRIFIGKIRKAAVDKDRILRGDGFTFPPQQDLGNWAGVQPFDIESRVLTLRQIYCDLEAAKSGGAPNRTDNILSRLKNFKYFAPFIALGVIIIALAGFTDAVGKLVGLASLLSSTTNPTYNKNLQLEIRVHNPKSDKEELSPIADLILTESDGPLIKQYPKYRIELRPTDGAPGYILGARGTRRFVVAINPDSSMSALLNRGAANANVILLLRGGGFLLESAPFIASTFSNKFLEFSTARMNGGDRADATKHQDVQSLEATLVDGVRVLLTPAIRFQIEPESASKAVASVGDASAVRVVVNEALKRHILRNLETFTLQNLLSNRSEVEDKITSSISEDLKPAGISILSVSLGEIKKIDKK